MIYNLSLIFVLLIFFIVGSSYGFSRAIGIIPVLFILFLLLSFLGWFTVNFFWLILLIVIVNFIKNRNRQKYKRRTYYYHYNNTDSAKDFEDFFRQASGFNGYQQQSNGYSYNNSHTPFGYTEDLTKYYKILGVQKGTSKEDIKKAYRELVKQNHPDKFSNATDTEKQYHENKLKEINEAYEKLIKD